MSESDSLRRNPSSDHIIPVRLTTVTLTFSLGVSNSVSVDPSILNSAGSVASPSGLSCAIKVVKL